MNRRGCVLATPPRWWGLVMVLLALVLSEIVPLNAVAQGAPLSVAVTNLNLASISGVEDRLALTFNGLLPIYSVTLRAQSGLPQPLLRRTLGDYSERSISVRTVRS